MALNPTTIEDLPEISSLLSSDQMILFTEIGGNLMPYAIELSSFSEFVLSANALADLSSKVSRLEDRYNEIEREFNKTYITESQADSIYSTISDYNGKMAKLEKTEDFKNALSTKGSKEYLEARFSELKNRVQDMKLFLGSRDWDGDNDEDGWGYKRLAVGAAAKGSYNEIEVAETEQPAT